MREGGGVAENDVWKRTLMEDEIRNKKRIWTCCQYYNPARLELSTFLTGNYP